MRASLIIRLGIGLLNTAANTVLECVP